ncbi:MAG: flagellar hook-length control protein FliK [Gallionella sp.]|nr:flagellar hook-length control protein FliK [Gallionella sp.]MDP1940004.1 flagellar hook-length control protein FliK [Gallionella sp.]
MLNTFTSSLPKLSAQGSLARSDESGITIKTDGKQGESFGSVLAKQMSGNTTAEKAANDTNSAESKSSAEAAIDEKEPQTAQATLADQATNPLAALLFANQELKTAIGPDAGGKAVVANELSAAATDSASEKTTGSNGEATGISELNDATIATATGGMLSISPELAGKTTTVDALNSNTIAANLSNKAAATAEFNDKATSSANKPATGTPALPVNSAETPNRASHTRTGAARDKFDAPVTATVTNADIAAKPGLRSEPVKATELTNALPGAMQAPQILTQANTAPGLQPAATPASNNTVTTPLGHSAWPAEFSQKVSWISTQKNQVAELHLNPPDLGPINITLKISDNQATALFTSPHSAVRDAIENAMPKLRESLADNGIMLGQATVSDQTPRDSSAHYMNQRANSRTMTDDTATPESALTNLPQMTTRQHKGMVDTFA